MLRIDVPVMILSSLLFLFFFLDMKVTRWEALLFVAAFIGYMAYQFLNSKKKADDSDEETIKQYKHWVLDILLIAVGLLGLVWGSNLLVENAVVIAQRLGMSEALIGLTIVAAGTSMPELATSLVAAVKKQSDIAIGNAVGSNIFNILLILGVSGTIQPIETAQINMLDSLFVVGISVMLWVFMKMGTRVMRWQGAAFLAMYLIYFFIKLSAI